MLQRNMFPTTSPRRHSARALRALVPVLAAGVAGLAVACADGPTAPASAPAQAFIPGPHLSVAPAATTNVTAFTLPTSFQGDSVAKFTVRPNGRVVAAPGGIATVRFPAGFVSRPTEFTITRKAGKVIAYDFQPSGTFNKPVTVTIALGGAAARFGANLNALQGAYVADWSQVNAANGTAKVNELVPTTVDGNAGTVTLTLSHFSGYLLSTGRR